MNSCHSSPPRGSRTSSWALGGSRRSRLPGMACFCLRLEVPGDGALPVPLTSRVSDSIALPWRECGRPGSSSRPRVLPCVKISQHGCQLPPSHPPPPARQRPQLPRLAMSGHPSPVVINNWVLGERRLLIPAQAAPGWGNLWKHWRPR